MECWTEVMPIWTSDVFQITLFEANVMIYNLTYLFVGYDTDDPSLCQEKVSLYNTLDIQDENVILYLYASNISKPQQ